MGSAEHRTRPGMPPMTEEMGDVTGIAKTDRLVACGERSLSHALHAGSARVAGRCMQRLRAYCPTSRPCERARKAWTLATPHGVPGARRQPMRALVYNGPRDVTVATRPDPTIEKPN